jgi:hypothetical protein
MCEDIIDPDDPSTWPPLVERKAADLYGELVLKGKYAIPQVADVSKIEVEITARDPTDARSFELPASHYEKILAHFQNSVIQEVPIFAMPEVACLKIWTKDRRFKRVCVYGAAHTSFCFSVQGVRCHVNSGPKDFHDPSRVFLEVLRGAEGER